MGETLKRDLNKTYLIIGNEDGLYEETYETEMIVKNKPQTFLPLHVLRVDGSMELYYDISSKQTLKACSDRVKLNGDTIKNFFYGKRVGKGCHRLFAGYGKCTVRYGTYLYKRREFLFLLLSVEEERCVDCIS